MKILIGFTYAPLAPDRYGCTPIHYAAANGNLDTTKFLVGLKDTPNALDNHGNTPNWICIILQKCGSTKVSWKSLCLPLSII